MICVSILHMRLGCLENVSLKSEQQIGSQVLGTLRDDMQCRLAPPSRKEAYMPEL